MNGAPSLDSREREPESVWDYPRPPAVEPTQRHVRVLVAGRTVADTRGAVRVLETSHPPVYYLPPSDVATELLRPNDRRTECEFKGVARYWDLMTDGKVVPMVAWSYPDPQPAYEALRDHLAFYPSKVERATVDGEVVQAQEGDFYGGWITSEVQGPFKGGPGTMGW